MSKRMFLVAMLAAVCIACASKQKVTPTVAVAPCVGDSKYAQVKIKVEHDNAGDPKDVTVVPSPVTIYLHPDPAVSSQKGQVCWVIEPVDVNGSATPLLTSLIITSKDGTAEFGTWTKKKKMPGDPLYVPSGLPNRKHTGWGYGLEYGSVSVDPVIIVVDESH